MAHLLVVSHSRTGSTRRLTEAVLTGARDPAIDGVAVHDAAALETGPDDVRAADALVLCTPANFGYMSGALKHFFDTVYYPVLDDTRGRPYALVVKGGHDADGAVQSVHRIVAGLAWREVQPPLVVVGDLEPAHVDAATELGGAMAAGLELGML